jgi:hypothetical protein
MVSGSQRNITNLILMNLEQEGQIVSTETDFAPNHLRSQTGTNQQTECDTLHMRDDDNSPTISLTVVACRVPRFGDDCDLCGWSFAN